MKNHVFIKRTALRFMSSLVKFRAVVYALLIADLIASFAAITYVYKSIDDIKKFWLYCVLISFGFFVIGSGWLRVGSVSIADSYEGEKRRNYIRVHIILFSILGAISLVTFNILLFVTGNCYFAHGIFASAGALFALPRFCDSYGAFIKFY